MLAGVREGLLMDTFDERAVGRAILDSPHVCVITTGNDGLIRSFSKGAENLLGYKAEELIGKQRTLIFLKPGEAEQHAQELASKYGVAVGGGREGVISGPMITGQPEENLWTWVAKDGSPRRVLMSLHILRDEKGAMAGFLGISIPVPEKME